MTPSQNEAGQGCGLFAIGSAGHVELPPFDDSWNIE
jgi:hypothetical protein